MDEVDSTNETVKRYASQGAESGTLIVAERQTAGKGRRGRSWESKQGDSLMMSLMVCPPMRPEQSAMLTLVTALAVCRALVRYQKEHGETPDTGQDAGHEQDGMRTAGVMPRIKWPNDVILGSRKICGILTELVFDKSGGFYVIIGIGINVNNEHFSEELAEKATSLRREWGYPVEREYLTEMIWQEFETLYDIFLAVGDLSSLKDEYEDCLVNRNRLARVLFEGEDLEGTAAGIDSQGRLLLTLSDGRTIPIDAGEVSVRGVYGYV